MLDDLRTAGWLLVGVVATLGYTLPTSAWRAVKGRWQR